MHRVIPIASSLISVQHHENQFWKSESGSATDHSMPVQPQFDDDFQFLHFHGTDDGTIAYWGKSPGPSFLGANVDVLSAQRSSNFSDLHKRRLSQDRFSLCTRHGLSGKSKGGQCRAGDWRVAGLLLPGRQGQTFQAHWRHSRKYPGQCSDKRRGQESHNWRCLRNAALGTSESFLRVSEINQISYKGLILPNSPSVISWNLYYIHQPTIELYATKFSAKWLYKHLCLIKYFCVSQ